MKKLLLFLLLIPSMVSGYWVKYYPKNGLRDAVAVILPDNYDPAKQWKWEIAIHGIGERSAGTEDNLKNLVLGPDYDGNGTRDGAPFVTADMKKAVDQYGIVLFVPTYADFFEPEKINRIYDFAHANYSLIPKFLATGFSYGGGAVVKYVTSSTANANRVAYAVPCAPTSNIVDASIPGKVGLPVHVAVNDRDNNGPTNIDVTKNIVSALNRNNPLIAAIYTAFRKDGHGSNIEMWALTPPKAPGGQGFIDAAENIYQVYSEIVATGLRRQMKSGTVVQPDPPTPDPIPSTDPVAEFNLTDNQVLTNETFQADASASRSVRTDWQGYAWDVKPVQGGSWGAAPEGGMYGGPVKKIIGLKDGKYQIALTVTNKEGKTNKKSVTVSVNTSGSKTAIGFDSSTDMIYYSDGSTEKGTAVFSGGKWTVKNSAGQIVTL